MAQGLVATSTLPPTDGKRRPRASEHATLRLSAGSPGRGPATAACPADSPSRSPGCIGSTDPRDDDRFDYMSTITSRNKPSSSPSGGASLSPHTVKRGLTSYRTCAGPYAGHQATSVADLLRPPAGPVPGRHGRRGSDPQPSPDPQTSGPDGERRRCAAPSRCPGHNRSSPRGHRPGRLPTAAQLPSPPRSWRGRHLACSPSADSSGHANGPSPGSRTERGQFLDPAAQSRVCYRARRPHDGIPRVHPEDAGRRAARTPLRRVPAARRS
jgi:hypothetical protein